MIAIKHLRPSGGGRRCLTAKESGTRRVVPRPRADRCLIRSILARAQEVPGAGRAAVGPGRGGGGGSVIGQGKFGMILEAWRGGVALAVMPQGVEHDLLAVNAGREARESAREVA